MNKKRDTRNRLKIGRGSSLRGKVEQRKIFGAGHHAMRLLRHLAQQGAFALPAVDDAGQLLLYTTRNGVTLGAGFVPFGAAGELERDDLAGWETVVHGARRFVATPAGRAHARRDTARGDDPFLAQHRSLAQTDLAEPDGFTRVTINEAESPLLWLYRRRGPDGRPFLDATAFAAGERLRRDLTLARMLPRVTVDWSSPTAGIRGGGGAGTATDAALAARQRATRALDAVGEDIADLLVDVCGFLKSLEDIETARGWPARSGKIVLRLALGRLAQHYGLVPVRGPEGSRGIRVWLDAARA
jgi:hypothetical protein